MLDLSRLGPWLRRFLVKHLLTERNLSLNTQRSYRDTLALLITFFAREARKKIDKLAVTDLSAEWIGRFLVDLEKTRRCSISTRNQRLAAIHAFAKYVATHRPEFLAWCEQIRSIPFKKHMKKQVAYLEKAEIDLMLDQPNLRTALGRRDHVILLFLYNTGARADEVAQLLISHLELASVPSKHLSFVKIRGKGKKERLCPLWPQTVKELLPVIADRDSADRVFLNRYGRPMTRFGIHRLVKRYRKRAATQMPALASKQVSPHSIRHTTATHLLRAGVDLNTIRSWLGHVSLNTTNVYAEIDLEMKAKALALCEVKATKCRPRWTEDKGTLAFLRSL
jgi:integrase/recombinase XerD